MKNAATTSAIVAIWLAFGATSVAALPAAKLGSQAVQSSSIHDIHWRKYRHCHWRNGHRYCHGKHYRRSYYGAPGIYLNFGTQHRHHGKKHRDHRR